MLENTIESGLHDVDSRLITTGRTKPTAAPPNVRFPGLPDNKVTKPKKKRSGKGAKHTAKRKDKEGGDNEGDNGGYGNESS